ncbi:MAG: hypothetical protein ACLS3M_14245 [Collinsella sp.]
MSRRGSRISIAIGCTGGQHRSVAIAEAWPLQGAVSCEHLPPRPVARQRGIGLHVVYR